MAVKFLQGIVVIITADYASCTIDGISYMDPLDFRPSTAPPGSDHPCNPLYWYPRQIPGYCYTKTTEAPLTSHPPRIPLPIPVPLPVPVPLPAPFPPFTPIMPPLSPPVIPFIPALNVPLPPALPCSVPIAATSTTLPAFIKQALPCVPSSASNPILPSAGIRYPLPALLPFSPYSVPRQIGMVPGLPGLVSPDGGINILPFSDAYSDMLEKHKKKLIRRRIKSVLKNYEGFPRMRNIKRRGKYRTNNEYYAMDE